MTVRETLDYFALSSAVEPRHRRALLVSSASTSRARPAPLERPAHPAARHHRICAEPELLVLDSRRRARPIVRRSSSDGDRRLPGRKPGQRTVFVSTHLIRVRGLIDEFTIIERGRAVLTLGAECRAHPLPENLRALRRRPRDARSRWRAGLRRNGREVELVVNGNPTT